MTDTLYASDANQKARSNLLEKIDQELRQVLRRGYHGTVAVEVTVKDGTAKDGVTIIRRQHS